MFLTMVKMFQENSIGASAPTGNYISSATLSILGPEARLKSRVKELVEELMAIFFSGRR